MKWLSIIATVLLFSLLLISCSSNNDPIALDWKIAEGEIIAYSTAINQLENPTISFNFDSIFDESGMPNVVEQQLGTLPMPEIISLISILNRTNNDNITVRMILHQINMSDSTVDSEVSVMFDQLMQSMVGTVQLRGELNPTGAIASFYLPQSQRNLLSMFFELPSQPVQVGDTWELDVNCIDLGSGFEASQADRINQVEFAAVSSTSDGRSIALLNYLIVESADGVFHSLNGGDGTPTSMTCSFIGQGQFLIDEGRWHQLMGEFVINSTGLITSNSVQQFGLTRLEEVPQQYLGMN